jgi:monoamine oxidase
MEDEADILIIGVGVAGLSAAHKLSSAGFNTIVLEARERIGGRINTLFENKLRVPIELGAEFVHGKPEETLAIIERGRIALAEVPNRQWYFRDGIVAKSNEFWSKTEDVMEKVKRHKGPDQSFRELLDGYNQRHELGESEAMVRLYVEGFHAARTERISVSGLNKTNEAADQIGDDKQFRTLNGYSLTNTQGHHGTVHGAIASGSRAAQEIIDGSLAT